MQLKILLQYLAPQHALSRLAGALAECRTVWFKNYLINYFINKYHVNLKLAEKEKIEDYPNFNSFFTRKLKPELRPIVQENATIACPVDGSISQIGKIKQDQIFQAKGFYYSLKSLLAGDETLTTLFQDGNYATLYLAPKDYHRVHMSVSGQLRETIHVPGKLFSVNQQTTESIPGLFARNERLICLFDTEKGPMIVILVGAMLVGSIQTVWSEETAHPKIINKKTYQDGIHLQRGDELGYFKMGSTVILLFPKDTITWSNQLKEDSVVKFGESMGKIGF